METNQTFSEMCTQKSEWKAMNLIEIVQSNFFNEIIRTKVEKFLVQGRTRKADCFVVLCCLCAAYNHGRNQANELTACIFFLFLKKKDSGTGLIKVLKKYKLLSQIQKKNILY